MKSSLKQCTIKQSVSMSGTGLHTGKPCRIALHPAGCGTGRVFITSDGRIPAHADYLADTRRGTSLKCGSAEVHTVEHLLAALAGLSIDNVEIEISGPELPSADGSALPFVELAESAGRKELSQPACIMQITEPVWVSDGDKYVFAVPWDGFCAAGLISFNHPMIGSQAAGCNITEEFFKKEIAPARTFCTSSEIEMVQSMGLGLGGSDENVIVAYEDRYNVPLRYKNEFVRHKILDLIGDLSLAGGRVKGSITAIKSSHTLNTALAVSIVKQIRERK